MSTQIDIGAIITALLNMAFQIYQDWESSSTGENIPSWDEIAAKNALLQAKIDVETK